MGMKTIYHYIISAPDAFQRREQIEKNFIKFGIRPNFITAVMGNSLTKQELQRYTAPHNILNKGAIGCALSHEAIYHNLLESKEPYVFVFEDDARITPEFIDELPGIIQFMNQMSEPLVLLLYKADAPTKKVFPMGKGKNILHTLAGTAAHGYVINRKAAKNLLDVQMPLQFEIDAWNIYYKLGYLKIYCTDTDLVFLDEKASSHSVIEQVAGKNRVEDELVKKYKQEHFMNLYRQYSLWQRGILQIKRVERHIRELYYDKE